MPELQTLRYWISDRFQGIILALVFQGIVSFLFVVSHYLNELVEIKADVKKPLTPRFHHILRSEDLFDGRAENAASVLLEADGGRLVRIETLFWRCF